MKKTTPRVVTSHKLEVGVGNFRDRAAGLGTVVLEDIGLELAMMLGSTLKVKHNAFSYCDLAGFPFPFSVHFFISSVAFHACRTGIPTGHSCSLGHPALDHIAGV